MKMKQIKKLADKFIIDNNIENNENDCFLLADFVAFLERENRTRKCGRADGSPQMPILPNLD